MWVCFVFNVVCKVFVFLCSWCISCFICFMLVYVVICRWILKMNIFFFNRGVFVIFEKEYWIKKEGGFCMFYCCMCIVFWVCLFVWSGKFGFLFFENFIVYFKYCDFNVMIFCVFFEFFLISWNIVEFSCDFYWVKVLGVFLVFYFRIYMVMFILDGCESLLEVNSCYFLWI